MEKSNNTINPATTDAPNNFYNNFLENLHVMGNKANYDWLMESKAQLESEHISIHNLDEKN